MEAQAGEEVSEGTVRCQRGDSPPDWGTGEKGGSYPITSLSFAAVGLAPYSLTCTGGAVRPKPLSPVASAGRARPLARSVLQERHPCSHGTSCLPSAAPHTRAGPEAALPGGTWVWANDPNLAVPG